MKGSCNNQIGREIIMEEILHMILKYNKVHKIMVFEKIPTIPLEISAGIDRNSINR